MAVRREKVVLELDDSGFSTQMLRNAVATTTLERALKSLDGTNVRIDQRINTSTRQLDGLSQSATRGAGSINQLTGRIAALAQATLVLGPGLIPISAVGIPAVTGLASALGFAAIGMGTLVTASQGVGDALKAVNTASLEPTAANLEKASDAMAKLGPEAQQFVARLQGLRPALADIRDSSAAGWFPGLTESLNDFERIAPRVADVFQAIGDTGGRLVAEGAEALAGPEWAQFITFVENEGPGALEDLGRSVGNVARGMAELWMAFSPLNNDFSDFLLDASRGFAEWADGLAETEGFQDFVDYIRKSGPQVERTLSAIADAVVAIVKAASPLGGPVLAGFEVIADVLTLIAESPAGSKIFTMAAAFVVLNKALAVTAGLMARAGFVGAAGAIRGAAPGAAGAGPIIGPARQGPMGTFSQYRADLRALNAATGAQIRASRTLAATQARVAAQTRAYGASAAKGAAGVGAFAVATGTVGQGLGLQNTAMLGLVGTMAGPWGAAVGASIGLVADISAKNRQWAEAQRDVNEAMKSNDLERINTELEEAEARLDKIRDKSESNGLWDMITDFSGAVDDTNAAEANDRKESEAEKQIRDLERAAQGVQATQKRVRALARDRAIEEWAYTAGSAFVDLAADIKKPETSLRDLTTRMREQGKAARQMGRNLQQALENGADPRALQELIDKLGPEAGLAMQQLARGGRKAAGEFNAAWNVSVRGLRRVEGAIMAVGAEIGELPNGKIIRVTAETQRAQAMLDRIRSQVAGIQDKTVRVTVFTNYLRGATLANQGGRDGDPATSYWSGGYTGHGGKYERAGDAHRGEVVIPQEDVQRDKAFLLSRYGHLPGMDQLAAQANAATAIAPVKVPRATVDRARAATAGPSLMHLTGTVQSELGPMRIEGIARAAARDEIDQQNTWERTQ